MKKILTFLIICLFLSIGYLIYYIKTSEDKKIPVLENIIIAGKIKEIKLKEDKTYLAVGDTYKIEYEVNKEGNIEYETTFNSNDENVATVDSEGVVTGISDGTALISITAKDTTKNVEVIVTSLITKRRESFDFYKPYLSCNQYTKEQNDLLDAILEYKVNKVGTSTRAGVVEAARFLTLDLPYKVNYFSENGRLHPYDLTYYVDGEGRYYHKGLYLHESRFSDIKKSMYGPATWGCSIYSYPSEGYRSNGLDCSGYVSWILLNGGFDPEDVGSGVSPIHDLTDWGTLIRLTEALEKNLPRTGDLLSGKGIDGGHIALIMGIKDGKYYVTESLWHGGINNGAVVKEYTKDTITSSFYWLVDMNDYYINDGEYTEYWD